MNIFYHIDLIAFHRRNGEGKKRDRDNARDARSL